MNAQIKWRPLWKIWIPIALFLIPLILEKEIAGTLFTPYLYGILLVVYGLVYYFRTRLWQAPAVTLAMSLAIWVYFLAFRPGLSIQSLEAAGIKTGEGLNTLLEQYFTTPVWFAFVAATFIVFITAGPLITRALDLESHAIKLFRLCARQVSGEGNGYTARPFSAGTHPYDANQLIGFASYLAEHKICMAQFPDRGIKLSFSMGISPLAKGYHEKISYVSFDENGNVNVFISESDYRQYRRQYTFDELCERMAGTFLRFARYYAERQERMILTELRSA